MFENKNKKVELIFGQRLICFRDVDLIVWLNDLCITEDEIRRLYEMSIQGQIVEELTD